MTPADISVVIPTLNEAATIAQCIESARVAGATQIIVADGDSSDATVEIAQAAGASKIVLAKLGRGVQLNVGAAAATGDIVLFLHADNLLAPECLDQVCQRPNAAWGAFRQSIDAPGFIYRAIERGNAWRVRVRRMPFGDQAIFVRRDTFHNQNGFADVPLMEDVEFSQRMRKVAKPMLLNGPVKISARRWQVNGVIRQTLRNWTIQLAFGLGTSPERLAAYYRR